MSFNEWKTFKLGVICSKIGSGATPTGGKESYLESGEYALVRSQNVLDFVFSYDGLAFINEEQASKLNNVTIEEGDVLLNITGDSVARVCQVPKNVLPARVNQHVAIIRPNKEILDNDFLKYYLLNPPFKAQLLNYSSVGATRNALTKGMIEELDVVIPNIDYQKRIAFILSTIDDKIENNLTTNQTLEEIARTLFKEWFVNFNYPNADGKMKESELGEIPESWEVGTLGDIANQIKESIKPSSYPEKMFQHYSLPAFDTDELPSKDLGSSILSNKTAVKKYSVLFSKLNPRIPRIWSVGDIDEEVSICSTEFIGFTPKQDFFNSYLNYFLKQPELVTRLTGIATGTSNSHQRIKPSDLVELEVLIPDDETVRKFEKIAKTILETRFHKILENEQLKTTRDSLLPKLMSGEIEVNV